MIIVLRAHMFCIKHIRSGGDKVCRAHVFCTKRISSDTHKIMKSTGILYKTVVIT